MLMHQTKPLGIELHFHATFFLLWCEINMAAGHVISSYARANVRITNEKNKRQIMAPSICHELFAHPRFKAQKNCALFRCPAVPFLPV